MRLKQTLAYPVSGYWDGGKKQVFYWNIDRNFPDGKSRVESWDANHFFEVKTGKTERQTLSYAKKHLQSTTKIECTFEYIED